MNFKVYTGNEEKTTYFKLFEDHVGSIDLYVVDGNGHKVSYGHILRIREDGLHLVDLINSGICIPLDKCGRIKLCKQE